MMMGQEDNRELISREELLKLANELIKKDYDYLDGMPTPKTNAVFNMFKKLSVTLSHKYKL